MKLALVAHSIRLRNLGSLLNSQLELQITKVIQGVHCGRWVSKAKVLDNATHQPCKSWVSATWFLHKEHSPWQLKSHYQGWQLIFDWLCHSLLCFRSKLSHAGNLDRLIGRKNGCLRTCLRILTLLGVSLTRGYWAFYELTQGLRESKSPQSHLFSWHVPVRELFCNRVLPVRHPSFVESENEDLAEVAAEVEPEPSKVNVDNCGRRFRACCSGLTGPFGPLGDVSAPWGNCFFHALAKRCISSMPYAGLRTTFTSQGPCAALTLLQFWLTRSHLMTVPFLTNASRVYSAAQLTNRTDSMIMY